MIPPIPTDPVSPNPIASPCSPTAFETSEAVRPGSAQAVFATGSTSIARSFRRSRTIPPSVEPVARAAVAAAPDRELGAGLARDRQDAADVLHPGDLDDHRGVDVDPAHDDGPRRFVASIAGSMTCPSTSERSGAMRSSGSGSAGVATVMPARVPRIAESRLAAAYDGCPMATGGPAVGAMDGQPARGRGAEKLNVVYHLVIGVAIGIASLFTLFAWPFAILTGIVMGKSNSDRRLGRRQGASAIQLLAVTGGVFAMLFFGALIGGLIGFVVVALAAFSERVAENASPIDQTMARIIIALVGGLVWFAAWAILGLRINVSIG